ncbi:hypothetical protein F9C07_8942 [Aspergillus flavus]|uniref:Uncharacterized protein n=4 Tax=Aspergillus subgen. Circumdati TaxID=2720871 RepID=B8NLP1_ASPFN|nr:uncharacterized protein G4B84_008548 [Aspergillus flavus NRRL3357]EIT78516.1 hypothetical protein Ao3042_05206 [Aspergillus oryzae 3.042]KAB8242636.1 hypothetical protein BDV35DRAFT_365647 [Aspergillus flavus]KDE83173.1 hypothetical protein AO1008_09690 [Aspergillus oryzae 100-8]OOO05475.1 hypothetical protein OAory_01069910 [Aspergillus oryzae]KAF7615989.1 hypothetical protein AFLA_009493 [Aspergillus flavus NRRL3357]|eukprot:EIT78516.1 hypothetical protein Ao3042_05206 [Aspergillus oryzae 3.042]
MSQPDPLSWTLLFKKHKMTVLLMLPPSATIPSVQATLLRALQSRGLTEINGDPVPEDSSDIEFGVAVDRNDLGKGWTKLEFQTPQFDEDEAPKRGAGRRSAAPLSLQAAEIRNGQPVAFRFRKRGEETETAEELIDLELEDPGWDVVLPSLDDEEEEN